MFAKNAKMLYIIGYIQHMKERFILNRVEMQNCKFFYHIFDAYDE